MDNNDNNDNMDSTIFEIIMNMLLKIKNKKYLFCIASNKSRDWAILFIQESSYMYASKYEIDDFKKFNIFKNCENLKLSNCIEIIVNLFKEKKDLIKIEEEENKHIKIGIELELGVNEINLSLGKEKLEFILEKEDVEDMIKLKLIWHSILFLFQEKEENQKIKLGQEKKIKKLEENISDLKIMINELKKSLEYYNKQNKSNIYNNSTINNNSNNNSEKEFNKSQIINESNIRHFNFIKQKLKLLYNEPIIKFKMIYSAKINGDSSNKFHELCDNQNNTLVIINTENNNIFGGFASKTWNSMELGRKKDTKSFIFSINKQKIYNPKLDDSKNQKYHLYCSDNEGPCFYAFSVENFSLKNGGICDEIKKCNYDSFEIDYEINNGNKNFKIKDLEIYKIIFNDYI